jgi:flagellar motor switch protein FliG
MLADEDLPVAEAELDGVTTAAILMMLIPEGEAAAILAKLDPAHVRKLGQMMFQVADSNEQMIEAALDAFVDQCRTVSALSVGAAPKIKTLLIEAFGNVRAENLLSDIAPQSSAAALDALRWMEVPQISSILANEHPQVGALVLAVLNPDVAAGAIAKFDEALQADLLSRAARLKSVSREAIEDLEMILANYGDGVTKAPPVKLGGRGDAAKIVNKMRKADGERIIKSIKKADRVLGQQIEDELLVFDDLAALDGKSLGAILRAVDGPTLTLALKGAEAATVDLMLACMSARAAQSIRDEMADSGPIKRADVEESQKRVVLAARKLAETGEIMLGGGGEDYV